MSGLLCVMAHNLCSICSPPFSSVVYNHCPHSPLPASRPRTRQASIQPFDVLTISALPAFRLRRDGPAPRASPVKPHSATRRLPPHLAGLKGPGAPVSGYAAAAGVRVGPCFCRLQLLRAPHLPYDSPFALLSYNSEKIPLLA